MRQVQLTAEAAQYVRFQLKLHAEQLRIKANEARKRAARSGVGRQAETYLAEALDRARSELETAHRGVNPNETQDRHHGTTV